MANIIGKLHFNPNRLNHITSFILAIGCSQLKSQRKTSFTSDVTVIAHAIVVKGFLTNPAVGSSLEGGSVTGSHDHGAFVFKIAGNLILNLQKTKEATC